MGTDIFIMHLYYSFCIYDISGMAPCFYKYLFYCMCVHMCVGKNMSQ